jgi:hypothetical protein
MKHAASKYSVYNPKGMKKIWVKNFSLLVDDGNSDLWSLPLPYGTAVDPYITAVKSA